MKVWLETSIANGPLNGAMQQETLDKLQVIKNLQRKDKLSVDDINNL